MRVRLVLSVLVIAAFACPRSPLLGQSVLRQAAFFAF
jgi:hypothetical protein